MKPRILFIGPYFFPEPVGIGKYSGEMVKWLAEQGYPCTVITTFPSYPFWKVQPPYEKRSMWFKTETLPVVNGKSIKLIRCPHYVPAKPSGMKRLISDFTFFFNANLVILQQLFAKKSDFVITVTPPFIMGLSGIFYKRIKGARMLYHIQDLQIDAARNLKMIQSPKVLNVLFAIERFIMRHSDWVSTISTGMMQKVKNKCNKEVIFFPNWVDTESFHPMKDKAALKSTFGFKPSDKVILYSGAIGQKQGLEAILDSAKTLEKIPEIKFAICGTGPYKEHLIKLRDHRNLQNVVFFNLQPAELFNCFLNMADLHLIIQRAGAGDLVLPSKLSTILAVGGVAIVTAHKGTSLYSILSSADMGILIEPENPDALVDAIANTSNFEIEKKSKNARMYAEKKLGSNQILGDFFSKILN